MTDSDLTKLRRARLRVHRQLTKLEPMVADYHKKLARIEAAILVLDPQLWLPPRRYQPNPHFARNELPRLALVILRTATGPIATKTIALRALAAKGVTLPDRRTMKVTRVRLQQYLRKLDLKGVTRKVGAGNQSRRVLA